MLQPLSSFFLLDPSANAYSVFFSHDPWLVALSVLLAIFLSIMAMNLAGLALSTPDAGSRRIVIATGALAQGAGVWAMHFVGMLALDLCASGRFDPWVTAVSVLPSVLAAWAALTVLARERVTTASLLLGGLLMGAGIGLMHYMGMEASQFASLMRYDVGGFAFSIGFAVAVACTALWLRFRLERVASLSRRMATTIGGIVMGLAIAGMHYIAIAALRVVNSPATLAPVVADREPTYMAVAIALLALVVALGTTSVNVNLRARRLLREARASESRQRAILDTAVDGVILIDGGGIVQSFNPAAERLLGWRADEVLGRNVTMLMPEPHRSAHDGYLQRHLATGHASIIGTGRDVQAQRKDGTLVPMRLAVGRVQQPGKPLFVGFLTDLTERQALERQRLLGAQQLKALVDNLPGVAFRCRRQAGWPMEFISEAVLALTGWGAQDFLQGTIDFARIIHPQDVESTDEEVEHALRRGQPYRVSYRIITRAGCTRWLSEHGRGAADESGVVRWLDGVILDITDVKARAAEFEGTVAAINRSKASAEFSTDGYLLHANDNYLALMGYTFDEAIARPHSDLCLPQDAASDSHGPFWQELLAGNFQSGEYQRVGKDGREVWLHATYNPILDAEGRVDKIIQYATDLSQRRAMEQDLRAAKERAEAAAAAQASFLANMSHEIRTPMNAILGFTEALLDSPLQPAQQRQLRTVHQSARSLLRLLNEILDAAKLDKGAVQLELRPFDLRELCEQTLATLHIQARAKSLALQLEYPQDVPRHWQGDSLRVQQVLLNLLGNAVKFTHQGQVQLSVSRSGSGVRLQVQDSGIGMDEAALARLFDRFSQADASTTRRYGGTGLGTSIARQLVELMNGRIEVRSEVGQGSCFTVHLPLPVAQPQQMPSVQEQAQSLPQLPPLRVLGVDDVASNLELLEIVMQRMGHGLVRAEDGAQALALFGRERFDIVLMDLHMPVMDGMQAARHMRAWERSQGRPRTPIIALSASVLDQDKRDALASGMDGFADKPLEPARLLAEMARCLDLQPVPAPASAQPHPHPHPPLQPLLPGASANSAAPAAAAAAEFIAPAIDWQRGLSLWGSQPALLAAIDRLVQGGAGLADLQAAAQSGDALALAAGAHRLRGAAANLGLVALQAAVQRLEAAAGDAAQRQPLLDAVQQALQQVRQELAGHQPDLPPEAAAAPPPGQEHTLDAAARTRVQQAVAAASAALAGGELHEAALQTLQELLPPARLQLLQDALDAFDFDAARLQLDGLRELMEKETA